MKTRSVPAVATQLVEIVSGMMASAGTGVGVGCPGAAVAPLPVAAGRLVATTGGGGGATSGSALRLPDAVSVTGAIQPRRPSGSSTNHHPVPVELMATIGRLVPLLTLVITG
jgi:hypothetical protein